MTVLSGAAVAQSTPDQQPQQTPPAQQPDQNSPDAGGPGGDNGVIALPKKKEEAPEPPPPPKPEVKNPPGMGNFSLRVDVPDVTVDTAVILQKTHEFVPGLKESNFRIFEDGVPQTITGFQRIQAPITAVLLLEFAAKNYSFIYDMGNAACTFAQQLKPDDYVAVMTYDMRTQILTDFTQDKRVIYQSLNTLTIPGFSETNVFDALYSALDRLSRIEGRKYIVLIASGHDTFSKITLDKILQKIKATPNVTIFRSAPGQAMRIMLEHGRSAGDRLPSGRQPDGYLCANDRRNVILPALCGRDAGHLPCDQRHHSEPVRDYLQTQQCQAGRQLSQAARRAGGR